jgi:WD40 repeat protein
MVTACAFSANDRLLVVGGTLVGSGIAGSRESLRIWDLVEGTPPTRLDITKEQAILSAVLFLPGSQDIVTGAALHRDKSIDGLVQFWDLKSRVEKHRIEFAGKPVGALAVSNDGRWLAIGVGGPPSRVVVVNLTDGKSRLELAGHGECITSLGFSPDSTVLVSSGGDGAVRAWDVATWRKLHELAPNHDLATVAVSPSAKQPVVAVARSKSKEVVLWNYQSGLQIGTLGGQIQPVMSLVFSPDARLLITAGDLSLQVAPGKPPELPITIDGCAQVLIWNVATGAVLSAIPGHRTEVRGLAFSQSGDHVVIGEAAGTLRLWEIAALGSTGPEKAPTGKQKRKETKGRVERLRGGLRELKVPSIKYGRRGGPRDGDNYEPARERWRFTSLPMIAAVPKGVKLVGGHGQSGLTSTSTRLR